MANSEGPDQTPQNAASGLGLHCCSGLFVPLLRVFMVFYFSQEKIHRFRCRGIQIIFFYFSIKMQVHKRNSSIQNMFFIEIYRSPVRGLSSQLTESLDTIKCLCILHMLKWCEGRVFGDNSGIFFLFLNENICCGYSLVLLMSTHNMFLNENMLWVLISASNEYP